MYTYIPVLQQRAWGISPRRRHLRSSCLLRGPWHREWQACCPCSHPGRGTGGGQEKERGLSSEIHTYTKTHGRRRNVYRSAHYDLLYVHSVQLLLTMFGEVSLGMTTASTGSAALASGELLSPHGACR